MIHKLYKWRCSEYFCCTDLHAHFRTLQDPRINWRLFIWRKSQNIRKLRERVEGDSEGKVGKTLSYVGCFVACHLKILCGSVDAERLLYGGFNVISWFWKQIWIFSRCLIELNDNIFLIFVHQCLNWRSVKIFDHATTIQSA